MTISSPLRSSFAPVCRLDASRCSRRGGHTQQEPRRPGRRSSALATNPFRQFVRPQLPRPVKDTAKPRRVKSAPVRRGQRRVASARCRAQSPGHAQLHLGWADHLQPRVRADQRRARFDERYVSQQEIAARRDRGHRARTTSPSGSIQKRMRISTASKSRCRRRTRRRWRRPQRATSCDSPPRRRFRRGWPRSAT